MAKKEPIAVEESSDNVFADLGFRFADRERLKADLTLRIYRIIKGRDLTQVQAGELLGIRQPHVSKLMRGHSGTFSAERLMEFLAALGQDVHIKVGARRKRRAEISVVAE